MITSQYVMLLALGCIATTWIIVWMNSHRARAVQHLFAALCVQALAAFLLSFASDSLPLSVALASIILGAVAWMIHRVRPSLKM